MSRGRKFSLGNRRPRSLCRDIKKEMRGRPLLKHLKAHFYYGAVADVLRRVHCPKGGEELERTAHQV